MAGHRGSSTRAASRRAHRRERAHDAETEPPAPAQRTRTMKRIPLTHSWAGLLGLATLLAGTAATASIYGPLDNFDVVNDTGSDTCGFEIEIEGVHSAEVYRTFDAPYIRYATPTMTDTPTGVVIRYESSWDPGTHTFSTKTPPAAPGYVPAADSCWTIGLGAAYWTSGCEHFGTSQTTQPTATRYHWLSCNPDGTKSPLPDIGLPTPIWVVVPPAAPADPPVVRAEIEIPNPEGGAYGEPYWVKIYKTEADAGIVLDDLLLDNALIANAETEIEWELLQAKPGQGLVFNEAPLGAGAEAVIRRYEFYRYQTDWGLANTFIDPETGLPTPYVDPANGEVVQCVVDGCNDPTPDELGDFIGRQIAGFNIDPAALLPACQNGIDDDGDGNVDLSDAGCVNADSWTESPACDDGVDEDGDWLTDMDDPGCAYPYSDSESPECDDGWDNDGDGLVDLEDGGCANVASNVSESPPAACGLFGIEPIIVLGALALRRRRAAQAVRA